MFFGEKGKKVNIRSYGGSAKWSTIPVNWLVKVQKRLSILHKFVSGQESSKGVLFEDTNVWVMIFKKRLVRAFNPIYQKVLSVAIGSNIFVRACALDNLFKYIGGIIQKERPLGTLRQGCNCSTFLSAHWAHFGGINPGTHHWRTHQRRFQHGNFVCACVCVFGKTHTISFKICQSLHGSARARTISLDPREWKFSQGLTSPSEKLLVAVN